MGWGARSSAPWPSTTRGACGASGGLEALHPPDDGSPWAREAPPPRDGCSLEVLVDGAEVLPAIAEAIRGARRSVRLAGWTVSPHFALERDEPPTVLRELLADAVRRGVDVRVLLWAGAPLKAFTPSRAAVRAVCAELGRGTGVRVAVDARERLLHCHHEKLVVVDDEVAFVGGVDLTDLGGDRWDTSRHPARGRLGWHDVGTRLRGPAVADVAEHLDLRWTAVTGEALPPVPVPAPRRRHDGPAPAHDPGEGLRAAAAAAPSGSWRATCARCAARASSSTSSPSSSGCPRSSTCWPGSCATRPPSGSASSSCCRRSRTTGRTTRAGCSPSSPTPTPSTAATSPRRSTRCTGTTVDQLYVHAKVGIVDDRWLTIGSANLNAHSFFNDTEVNVAVADPALARATRLRLWAEHLELPVDEVAGAPADVVDRLWRPIARRERERRERGEPREHRLRELTPGSRRLERLLGPMDAVVVDG